MHKAHQQSNRALTSSFLSAGQRVTPLWRTWEKIKPKLIFTLFCEDLESQTSFWHSCLYPAVKDKLGSAVIEQNVSAFQKWNWDMTSLCICFIQSCGFPQIAAWIRAFWATASFPPRDWYLIPEHIAGAFLCMLCYLPTLHSLLPATLWMSAVGHKHNHGKSTKYWCTYQPRLKAFWST